MNSGCKNTSTYRNFIRTPRIISTLLGVTLWLLLITKCHWSTDPWRSTFLAVLNSFWIPVIRCELGEWLTMRRVEKWALVLYGIGRNDLDKFIDDLCAYKFEEMVAFDFDGQGKTE